MDQSCSSPTRSASVVSPRLCFALWTAADCSVHTSTHARAQPLHFQRHHPCTLRLALATPRPRSQGQRPHQVRPTLCFSQSSVDRPTCRQRTEWFRTTPPPLPRRRPPPPPSPRTRPTSLPTQSAPPLAIAVLRPPPPETATPTTPTKSARVSSVETGTGRTSPRLRAHSLAAPPLRDKTGTRLCLARGGRKTGTRTRTGERTTSRARGRSSACWSAATLVSCARPPRSTRPRSHSRLSSTARRSTSEADARATTRPTRRRTSPAQPRACASPRARLSALAQR